MIKTDFYKLLKNAVTDDTALICVIEKLMPLINKLSRIDNGIIDEDLKSVLITYSIEIIRKKKIYKIF